MRTEVIGSLRASEYREREWRVIGITNDPSSPLGQQADVCLTLAAPFDHSVSVVMYSAMALVGGLLAEYCIHGRLRTGVYECLNKSLDAAAERLSTWCESIQLADWIQPVLPTYFLARRGSLATCHEARLLWEEAAKSPATAMSTSSFSHGPQEILADGTRVGLWIDSDHMRDEDLFMAQEIRDAGGKVMIVGQDLPRGTADLDFALPPCLKDWQFLIDMIHAQLAAERLSHLCGVDCDSFRMCSYIVESAHGLCEHSTKSIE